MVSLKDKTYTRRGVLALLGAAVPAAYLASRPADRNQVQFLITADVHDQLNLCDDVNRCLDRLAFLELKITFFLPAVLTAKPGARPLLRRMLADGHQVACHGLTHDDSENYDTDRFEVQRRNLTRAKQLLEDATGSAITAFRAPEFRISNDTLNVLDGLGFAADLSICSQRLPWFSSQIGNYHWLFSPRAPYHPSNTNPYAKGNLKLLEIPTSAALLPLMSALNSVSMLTSKILTNILRYEAAVVRKPIVYQCHPEDFVLSQHPSQPMKVTWRSLLPTRHGIPLRWSLEETDGNEVYKRNQEFLAFLMGTKAFRFLKVDEYFNEHESAGLTMLTGWPPA